MSRKSQPDRDAAAMIGAWRSDANLFVRQAMGIDPTPQQAEILAAISDPGSHVSVRSGHGIGKTSSFAWTVLWFLSCFSDARVPCTAPSGHQLYDLLWAELTKWRNRMAEPFRSGIRITQERAAILGSEMDAFAVPRTARKEQPEALQGFHARNLLFVLDEASGIPEQIFEVAEGALSTPGARVLMAGNPTRASGYFYRTHTRERSDWTTLHFSSEDSPLVDPAYCERMAKRYGRDSNVYRIRVTGDFPQGGDDVVIPLGLLEHAQTFLEGKAFGQRIAGVDIARFGDDDSTLVIRHGNRVPHMERWHGYDTTESAGRITAAYRAGKFDLCKIDAIGYGAGVADVLRQNHVPTQDVVVSEAASDTQYMRMRDQLWFAARDWLQGYDVTFESNALVEELIEEACAVTYTYTPAGKYQVQSKDEIKETLGHSPDLTDALCCTFAPEVVSYDDIRAAGFRRPK